MDQEEFDEMMKTAQPMAYQGKEGCESWTCTRLGFTVESLKRGEIGECIGWHCHYCHGPSSMYGHRKCQDNNLTSQ